MSLTLNLLLTEGVKLLTEAGIEEASLDARYLLFEAFDTDMTHFLLDRDRIISENDQVLDQVNQYRIMIKKRTQRIPLQQITKSWEFMGLKFYVNEHVLIPRQDTETLVELILKDYQGRKPVVLDMCTGSGCIAVCLSKIGGFDDVTGADISKEALKVAKRNADVLLGPGRITLIESDLFKALEPEKRFDIIVSNPPYIPTEMIKELQPEVRDFEPMLALDGKEDGLFFYRQLVSDGQRFLNPGGAVYFEIGYDQAEPVRALLENAGFAEVRVVKDGAGLDRVVCAVLK